MSIVALVSGGLDSTLIGVMAKEEGTDYYPLFIDYGQRAANREWTACLFVHQQLGLPAPVRMDISGYGKLIISGLTSEKLDVREHAFTPGRNLLFLLMGAAYAYQIKAAAVAIGLLSEEYSLFPDQSNTFIESAEKAIQNALGKAIRVIAPLFEFNKAEVIALAEKRGITGTYSCHSGDEIPCGRCVSCLELTGISEE